MIRLIAILVVSCYTTHVVTSPVVNTGIIALNLNAERDLGVWTATGRNGTTGEIGNLLVIFLIN